MSDPQHGEVARTPAGRQRAPAADAAAVAIKGGAPRTDGQVTADPDLAALAANCCRRRPRALVHAAGPGWPRSSWPARSRPSRPRRLRRRRSPPPRSGRGRRPCCYEVGDDLRARSARRPRPARDRRSGCSTRPASTRCTAACTMYAAGLFSQPPARRRRDRPAGGGRGWCRARRGACGRTCARVHDELAAAASPGDVQVLAATKYVAGGARGAGGAPGCACWRTAPGPGRRRCSAPGTRQGHVELLGHLQDRARSAPGPPRSCAGSTPWPATPSPRACANGTRETEVLVEVAVAQPARAGSRPPTSTPSSRASVPRSTASWIRPPPTPNSGAWRHSSRLAARPGLQLSMGATRNQVAAEEGATVVRLGSTCSGDCRVSDRADDLRPDGLQGFLGACARVLRPGQGARPSARRRDPRPRPSSRSATASAPERAAPRRPPSRQRLRRDLRRRRAARHARRRSCGRWSARRRPRGRGWPARVRLVIPESFGQDTAARVAKPSGSIPVVV